MQCTRHIVNKNKRACVCVRIFVAFLLPRDLSAEFFDNLEAHKPAAAQHKIGEKLAFAADETIARRDASGTGGFTAAPWEPECSMISVRCHF